MTAMPYIGTLSTLRDLFHFCMFGVSKCHHKRDGLWERPEKTLESIQCWY